MRHFFVVAILFVALCFHSCDSDFRVTSDWKEITIAYAILDPADDDHFIRIQKAFLDENTSALKIASIADSLYHEGDLFVELTQYEEGRIISGDTLELVNAIDFDLEKEQNDNTLFGNDPFLLYHTDLALKAGAECRLKILTPGGNVLNSSTTLISDFIIWLPTNNRDLNLASRAPYTRWESPEEGAVYGLGIQLFYSEELSGTTTQKSIFWDILDINPIGINQRDLRYEFDINVDSPVSQASEYANEFFDFLANNIEVNNLATRSVDSLQYIYSFGSQSMFDYNQVLVAQQQSIAGGGQGITPFSNIENGFGLFATRSSKKTYTLILDIETQDSLACSPITRALNFKAATPQVRCR